MNNKENALLANYCVGWQMLSEEKSPESHHLKGHCQKKEVLLQNGFPDLEHNLVLVKLECCFSLNIFAIFSIEGI